MQHYGVPTRVLDWTASPFVAAYFAVAQGMSDAKEPGVVWIVQAGRLMEYMTKSGLRPLPDDVDDQGRALWDPPGAPGLTFVRRPRLTDRMTAQQTYFSVSTHALTDHNELIARAIAPVMAEAKGLEEADVTVLKVFIPSDLKPEFLHQLRAMNITAGALFPGMDGLGRSLTELTRLAVAHLGAKAQNG
jgi:hypothetical protein